MLTPAESVALSPFLTGIKLGVREQAAITVAEIAKDNDAMQSAIIQASGVPPLLTLIRLGSQLGQEHAARAIWHLSALTDRQMDLVDRGAIPDLVQLLKMGSLFAQEMAAAGLASLAHGCVMERQARPLSQGSEAVAASVEPSSSSGGEAAVRLAGIDEVDADEQERSATSHSKHTTDRLLMITEAGGIMPLVTLLGTGTPKGRENAAEALWHLALEKTNQGVREDCPRARRPPPPPRIIQVKPPPLSVHMRTSK